MTVEYRVPKSNPSVRERINLVNRQLRSAAGDDRAADRSEVQGTDQGLRAGVLTRRTATQIDKDRDRMRTHLSDALGYLLWQECRPRASRLGEQADRGC